MIRERTHVATHDLAGWNQALDVLGESNRLAKERGWPTGTAWTLVSGPFNEIVVESDYADLAEYERVQREVNQDTAWITLMKPLADAMVMERSYNELLTKAESIG
ncbi:MAG TPA: hypothetical protein VMT27_09580 [Actinomycetes bacterium]|nr:hypothetical protein [Actinomycetes bacterium]